MNGMDPRAAKALAACIATLIEAKVELNRITEEQQRYGSRGSPNDLCVARVKCAEKAKKAEAAIAEWLRQPMTTAHLVNEKG
jgi:hypothetical protein